jgi:Ni/Fe-hydrogenase subunit HybB-like protein
VFWLETFLISYGGWMLPFAARTTKLRTMFLGYILSSLGGMIYRFSPTTLAFRPNPESLYFPSTIEVLVSLGFICMGIAGFLFVVKRFGILPAPAPGMARHGELLPVPQTVHSLDWIFQVWIFRRKRT